jgi:GH35 family endo-1,4-beta-xylanase
MRSVYKRNGSMQKKIILTSIIITGIVIANSFHSLTPHDALSREKMIFLDGKALSKFNEKIKRLRKGNFTLSFLDKNGNPIRNAGIAVQQKKHEFRFGGALFTPLFDKSKYKKEKQRILQRADEMFNVVVDGNGFKWKNIEKNRGEIEYGFKRHLLITEWAKTHNKDIRHHCLFWSNPKSLPVWVSGLSNTEFRKAVFDRIKYTRENTGENIRSLDVMNEMLYFRYYRGRLGESITKDIFDAAKMAFPDCKLYLNEFPPQRGKDLSCFQNYIELIKDLKKRRLPFEGIGLQAHFSSEELKQADIDPLYLVIQMDKILDDISVAAGLPILITEYDMKTKDENTRADFLEMFYTMAFSNPNVEGIIAWEWFDEKSSKALVKRDGSLTKAGRRYYHLLFSKWWTKTSYITDNNGRICTNAFFGDYEISINYGGKISIHKIKLRRESPKAITLFACK